MTPVKVGIVEVDRCTSCGGLWFDSLEEEWLKTPDMPPRLTSVTHPPVSG